MVYFLVTPYGHIAVDVICWSQSFNFVRLFSFVDCEMHFKYDLYCVERGVKLYSLTHSPHRTDRMLHSII